tara:strand:- start:277 stop:441 length:165 start_codon:yes stop_codon:yes gene_type:complete
MKPHPYDTWPMAKETKVEPSKKEEKKKLKIATSKYNPFSVGGSENIHDFDKKNG